MFDRYQDKELALRLITAIHALDTPLTVMEVCGTHTMSIAQYGLRELLAPTVRLVSGPGCPVCVTDAATVGAALLLARQLQVILTSFGDMLRVPAGNESLLNLRDQGADVRMVISPLDALTIAEQNPLRQVIFFAVGFETTAPLTAVTLELAQQRGVKNFRIIPAHKTMPAALRQLLQGENSVDALLCPGHVAAVTGSEEFAFVPRELGLPAAISGFAPVDILYAIYELARMKHDGCVGLSNCYRRAVTEQGNPAARSALERVFTPGDAVWRGLGAVPGSGLLLRERYADFDALRCSASLLDTAQLAQDDPRCCCGAVLQGKMAAEQCPLFGRSCRPEHPAGACMVSGEGACAAAYKYRKA